MWDMNHSLYTRQGLPRDAGEDKLRVDSRRVYVTHSYVWHDSFIVYLTKTQQGCVWVQTPRWPWVCLGVTCLSHNDFIRVTWLIHMRGMAHIYVTWLIHICKMIHDSLIVYPSVTHSNIRHYSWDMTHSLYIQVWLIHVWDMTHPWDMTHLLNIQEWLIHIEYSSVTQSYMRHDSSTKYDSFIVYPSVTHSCMRHDPCIVYPTWILEEYVKTNILGVSMCDITN